MKTRKVLSVVLAATFLAALSCSSGGDGDEMAGSGGGVFDAPKVPLVAKHKTKDIEEVEDVRPYPFVERRSIDGEVGPEVNPEVAPDETTPADDETVSSSSRSGDEGPADGTSASEGATVVVAELGGRFQTNKIGKEWGSFYQYETVCDSDPEAVVSKFSVSGTLSGAYQKVENVRAWCQDIRGGTLVSDWRSSEWTGHLGDDRSRQNVLTCPIEVGDDPPKYTLVGIKGYFLGKKFVRIKGLCREIVLTGLVGREIETEIFGSWVSGGVWKKVSCSDNGRDGLPVAIEVAVCGYRGSDAIPFPICTIKLRCVEYKTP